RTGWELDTLVSALMTALPDHAASPLMTRLQDELRTESVRSQAREQFTGAVDRIFDTAESVCAYFHERRSLNNFHRDRVITFEQIAE
ncbi:GTPase family protein, partial [Escherichia coli]